MKTFAIQDGDLVLAPGGYKMLEGPAKVRQDLAIAVREPMACDRFHPRWGSLLGEYVGDPVSVTTEMKIQGEVSRLIQNYVASQNQYLQRDATRGRRPRFSTNEIVRSIKQISIRQEYDRFHVRVEIDTVSGEAVQLVRTVSG